MKTITIRSKRYNCTISIHQKITIIRGYSGRGKTIFYNSIAGRREAVKIGLSDNKYTLSPIDHNSWFDVISQGIEDNKKRIYVIDDDDFVITEEFARLLSQDKFSYYVIINRFTKYSMAAMNNIPFSVNEVYEFVTSGKEHTIVPFFKYEPVYVNSLSITRCIVEDSSSGFEFFKELYKFKEVKSTYGKDNMIKYFTNNIDSLIDGTTLLVADMASFGSQYEMVKEFTEANHISVISFRHYNCFEYLLLCSNMFNFDFEKLSDEEIISEISLERLSEVIIDKLTKSKFYHYSKSKLNGCYIKECCYRDQSKSGSVSDSCDKGIQGDKIEVLLKGTKFEKLLDIR